jgi:hypothetical protein
MILPSIPLNVFQEPERNPRCPTMKTLSIPFVCLSFSILPVARAQGLVEVTASRSLTIQPGGPRSGEAGTKYFNIEGKDNEKYASFGVLVFEIPKEVRDKKVTSMTLTLVQSIPRFAKDGAIRVFLARNLGAPEHLEFDPNAADGVGKQIKNLHELGSVNFKKVETGKTESFSLAMDDVVRQRIANGGKLYLVIVPADAAVAATYFGAGENAKEDRPRLTLDLP